VQLVINGQVVSFGGLPAGNRKSMAVKANSGMDLQKFVQDHGRYFVEAVNSRQHAFGDSSGGQISDLENASMAASFISMRAEAQDYYRNFIVPPGLDLSRTVERGTAELLVWMPDYAPIKPLNQFKTKRGFRHTLWRIPVEISKK